MSAAITGKVSIYGKSYSASDHEELTGKPQINGVELTGDKSSQDLGLQSQMDALTQAEIDGIIEEEG